MKNIFTVPDEKVSGWASNPPFDRRHLRAIELAVRKAWELLHKDRVTAQQLSDKNEEHVSHLLREALNDLREKATGGVAGYDCNTFERPHVGAEIKTPGGKVRKPDIVFGLAGCPRPGVSSGMRDGIFVECKILQQGTKKNVAAYCRDGVHRFVEGSYAAWMREGMMLAYVRTSQSLPGDLVKRLRSERKHLATDGELRRCSLTLVEPRVHISVHEREWPYPDGTGFPGPIEVRHLWLVV
jgi:hypothetical protein